MQIRLVEFFSGLGGMRWAIERAGFEVDECLALDISMQANAVYAHNFKDVPKVKLVEQLTSTDISAADLWTMSPPCQPFTNSRFAKQRDVDDPRCAGFLSILKLLKDAALHAKQPRWILLENVKGFYNSRARDLLLETLRANDYSWQECLLSPIQIGIPNHRKRYYILCERSDRFFQRNRQRHSPASIYNELRTDFDEKQLRHKQQHTIADYILYNNKTECEPFAIPAETLTKLWAKDLPVVSLRETASHCFTAAYSRQLHRSSGSLLLMEVRSTSIADDPIDRHDMTVYKLRRFAPAELLLLFGFSSNFGFPDGMSLEHQYRLIGNSVSVHVVTELMKELLVLGENGYL
jgi:tRNA (cytosine38-C5)-methyltransferase